MADQQQNNFKIKKDMIVFPSSRDPMIQVGSELSSTGPQQQLSFVKKSLAEP